VQFLGLIHVLPESRVRLRELLLQARQVGLSFRHCSFAFGRVTGFKYLLQIATPASLASSIRPYRRFLRSPPADRRTVIAGARPAENALA
jgi:hypothetical protein